MKSAFINKFSVILILISTNVYGEERAFLYDFPPLHKFDDYDACFSQKHDNSTPIYAMVFAEIKPKNSSEMWQQMKQYYKEYLFRYRHDRLFFGVCLERCKNLKKTADNYKLKDNDLIKNEITDYFIMVHKRPLDIKCREEFHELIHNCLNVEFQGKYDLNLRTFVEYCEESKIVEGDVKEDIDKDHLENLLYIIIAIIIILNILSTSYDYVLKQQQPEEKQTNEFYKINRQETVSRLLTSFSIRRNYYRLIQPYIGDVGKDFQFLDAYRSVCMLFALFGHTVITTTIYPANSKFFELRADKDDKMFFLLNMTTNIETYFVMSGILLFIKCHQGQYVTPQTSWKKLLLTYVKLMTYRFSRFFPSLALLLLVNATILSRLQDGPFWRHVTEPTRIFSREKAWSNLLMINNFSHKESANFQTWYLAADWQLFGIYLMIIFIVSKNPQYKKLIYSLLAILSVVTPFLISYLLKLEPCLVIIPEFYRYGHFKDLDVYYYIYIPFYTNLFGYLFGIIVAEIYLKYTRKPEVREFIAKQFLARVAFCLVPVMAYLISWSGVALALREPSIWSAIYAAVHRNLWIIFICGIPMILMSCNFGGIAYKFCCLPIFRILARLTFQVYIWHITILFMISGSKRQPYYVNNFYLITQLLSTYFVTYILAFFIALFMEYPLTQSVQWLQSLKILNTKKS